MERTQEIGNGFYLFCSGIENKRNIVGISLDPKLKRNVLKVNRESDLLIKMNREWNKSVNNVMSAYTPQVGCDVEKRVRFWNKRIPNAETIWIGGDPNGQVSDNNNRREHG